MPSRQFLWQTCCGDLMLCEFRSLLRSTLHIKKNELQLFIPIAIVVHVVLLGSPWLHPALKSGHC